MNNDNKNRKRGRDDSKLPINVIKKRRLNSDNQLCYFCKVLLFICLVGV